MKIKFVFIALLSIGSLIVPHASPAQLSHDSKAEIIARVADIPDSKTGSVAELADYLTGYLEDEETKAWAIYYWVANNIRYDLIKAENVTIGSPRDKILQEALHERIGVCQHYAELFNALALESGLDAVVVSGYVKQNGDIGKLPHAWNAAKIDGNWFLFDPTWGAGHVMNDRYREFFTEDYFKIEPEMMIKSHMPFDYLFQFLNYPIGHSAFEKGKYRPDSTFLIDYKHEIDFYRSLPEDQQVVASMARVKELGIANSMIRGYYSNLNQQHRVHLANQQVDLHNKAIDMFNEVVDDYNVYVNMMNSRGGRFPENTTEIEKLLLNIEQKALEVDAIFKSIDPPMKLAQTMAKNQENLDKLLVQIRKELQRLEDHKRSR